MKNTLKLIIDAIKIAIDKISWNNLKDKPFYEENIKVVVIPETTSIVEGNSYRNPIWYDHTLLDWETPDNTYIIKFDGIEYEAFLTTDDVGDKVYKMYTSEHQYIRFDDVGRIMSYSGDIDFVENSSHTYKVYYYKDVVKTIDPKYIKDMYYESDPVETVIVEETTTTLEEGGEPFGMLTATHPLEVRQEYIVTIDGTIYNCVAKMYEEFGASYIGNLAIMGGEDTGEPFFIAPMQSPTDTVLGIMINSAVAEYTVSIKSMLPEVHKIDKKYLPDTVFTVNVIETGWDEENDMPILSADKTFDEIYEAYQNGLDIQAQYDGTFTLDYIDEYSIEFSSIFSEGVAFLAISRGDDENNDFIGSFADLFNYVCEFYFNEETGEWHLGDPTFFNYTNETRTCFICSSGDRQEFTRNSAWVENGLEVYFKDKTLVVNTSEGTVTEKVENDSGFISTIINLPSDKYPNIDNETFLSLPDGMYNCSQYINVVVPFGVDEEGNVTYKRVNMRGLLKKDKSDVICYETGMWFCGLANDDSSSYLTASEYFTLDGFGALEAESFIYEIISGGEELTTESQSIVGAINEVNKKVSNSSGTGGGTSFKTFNLQLDENANLEIVDMGNNIVVITFWLKSEESNILAEEGLMYMLPTDNAEFTDWFKDKAFVIQANPIVSLYGKTGRQGTYCNFSYLGMLGGVETELGGGFMLMPTFDDGKGFTDEKLLSMTFTTVANSVISRQYIG